MYRVHVCVCVCVCVCLCVCVCVCMTQSYVITHLFKQPQIVLIVIVHEIQHTLAWTNSRHDTTVTSYPFQAIVTLLDTMS